MFKNKNVLITGGTGGIGRACCRAFAEEGAGVAFTYFHSEEKAGELVRELNKVTDRVLAVKADIREPGNCKRTLTDVLDKFGRLDILVNNAGITRDRVLVMMTDEDWNSVLDTNLNGTFNMSRACATGFLRQKSGCIINISSVSGIIGIPGQTNYSASKAGIIGFSKALAKETAAYNVRVNVICPGYIDTDMIKTLKPRLFDKIVNSIPMKRFGRAEEVAGLCLFLSSDKSAYITGEIVKIDGGMAI